MPEVRIDTNLRGTAKRTKVNLGIAELADYVMLTLIFAGFVAVVADFTLKLIFYLMEPPFGSFDIFFKWFDNARDIIFRQNNRHTHYIRVYNEYFVFFACSKFSTLLKEVKVLWALHRFTFLTLPPVQQGIILSNGGLAHYQHGQRSSCRKPCTLWSSPRRCKYSGCRHCMNCHSAAVPWCNCFGKFPASPVSPAVCIDPPFS